MPLPSLTLAQVVQPDPDNGGLIVTLRTGGQAPTQSVQVLYYGPADALRIKQAPLPGRGTMGVVAFPYGDSRNGIWLGSILPSQVDAIAGSVIGVGPTPATDANFEYEAFFSGAWSLIDSSGQVYKYGADGSFFSISSGLVTTSGDLPIITRHTLETDGSRKRSPFTQAQRRPTRPTPYNWTGWHPSGTYAQVDSSGNILVSGAAHVVIAGASGIVVSGAGSSISVDASGNVIATGVSGSTLTFSWNGSTIQMDSTGNVKVTLAGSDTFQIGGNSDALVLASKLVTIFNAHHHLVPGVMTGGGVATSQGPSTPISSSDVQSVVAKAGS